jgi:hypothetical protein
MVDYVDTLDASLDLNFGSSEHLTGELGLQWLPTANLQCCLNDNNYNITSSNLSLNGSPMTLTGIPKNAFPSSIGTFTTALSPLNLVVLGLTTNFLPPNPTYANSTLNRAPGTSGTVTVNSEHLNSHSPARRLAVVRHRAWWIERRRMVEAPQGEGFELRPRRQ